MKNTRRSAFTIVELVIVIAVIAILSAVLIPTFGAIIKDANIAADQAAASTLTSELHVELKGKQITNEAELMAEISKIDAKKLTPKSAAYGVHFWFDMDNQMIIAKTAAEIEKLVEEKNAESASALPTGVQLINNVQPLAETDELNINFRSLLGGGFYLIDQGGSAFVNALKAIADFDCTKAHSDLVNTVNGIFADVAADDQAFVEKFKAALASTVIITEDGVAQPTTATNVYFEPGIRFLNNHGTISSITSGTVELPSTVIGVATGALVFGSDEVVLKTSCKDASDVEYVFANASTNATIKTATESYKIADATGKVTIDETDALANKIVPVNTIENGAGKVVEGITLSNKLEVEGFSIYAAAGVPGDNSIIYNIAGDIPTLYVSYNDYAKTGKEIILSLLANDGKTIIEGADSAITWNFGGLNTYKVSLNSTTDTATVTASARNMNGEVVTKSLNIEVVKPKDATVTIGSESLNIPGGVNTQSFEWGYDGTNGTRDVAFTINSYTNNNFAHGTSNLEVAVDSDVFTYDETTKKLTLKTKGGTGDDAINLAKAGETTITLSIDGVITATIDVTVNDYTDSRLISKFNHSNDDVNRPYYIGNGEITLGQLLKLKDTNENIYDSVMNIYVYSGSERTLAKNMGYSVTYDSALTADNWEEAKINFTSGTNLGNICIEIVSNQVDDTNEACITRLNLVYVNATNVTSILEMNAAFTDGDGKSVVLLNNINSVANGTVINVGANTLYGNGFVIDASSYIATATGNKCAFVTNDYYVYCSYSGRWSSCNKEAGTSCKLLHGDYLSVKKNSSTSNLDAYNADVALIEVSGGTIDNIYIDGPVYPTMQYLIDDNNSNHKHASTPFYVSGIKTSGTSTITNSYVSGFRQPVKAEGTKLILTNSTLRGGNYANMVINASAINLTNVTTVQDGDGVANTVAYGDIEVGELNVIGLGIVMENSATTITMSGYLNQFNWVEEDTNADLPTLEGINIKTVFGYIFDGFEGLTIGRFLDYIHEETNTDNRYINTGILYAKVGTTEEIDALTLPTITFSGTRSDYALDNKTVTKRDFIKVPMDFSGIGLTVASANITAATYLELDGYVAIWSYKDGQAWSGSNGSYTATYETAPIQLKDGSNYPITYFGYYDNSGAYEYWFESTNTNNQ